MYDERARERLLSVRRRVNEMIHDPFAGQMLRDLVPEGSLISPALAEETLRQVVPRAIADSKGTPAFLAVDEPGRDAVTLLYIRRQDDGWLRMGRPGDWCVIDWTPEPDNTLGDVIAALRAANDGP